MGIITEKNSLKSANLLVEKKGINYYQLLGDDALAKKYMVKAMPHYVLIDQKGEIIFASAGYDPNIEKVIKKNL